MNNRLTNGRELAHFSDMLPASLLGQLLENIFPTVPDFFSLLNDQCDIMVQAMDALVAYMARGEEESATLVRQLERGGDEVKTRNMAILAKAFATPLDREDIYRAIASIDMILNYAKTTVREMEVLRIIPDSYMLEMTQTLRNGSTALCRGFAKLSIDPLEACEDERIVHLSVYEAENGYRKALTALFDGHTYQHQMLFDCQRESVEAHLMRQTIEMFKHRELYRHLSNLGNHLSIAGTVLYDIMVQV